MSNIRRIIRISTTDYAILIATAKGTSSCIASRWPKMSNFVTYSIINLQPSRVIKNANIN